MSEMQEPFQELNTGILAASDAATDGITDDEFLQLRQKCGRFRVLFIGAEAVGKTTLLERFAGDNIDKAQISSPDGEIVRIVAVILMQRRVLTSTTHSFSSTGDLKKPRV